MSDIIGNVPWQNTDLLQHCNLAVVTKGVSFAIDERECSHYIGLECEMIWLRYSL